MNSVFLRKTLLLPTLLLALALSLTACGGIESGRVVNKKYFPEEHGTNWVTITTGQNCTPGYNGGPQTCTPITQLVPQPYTNPQHCTLYLEAKDKDGKTKKGRVNVDETTFHQAKPGYYWDNKKQELLPQ